MGLFDTGAPTNLEQILNSQATNRVAGVQDDYTQARKRLVSQQAASGRLMSGVADYPLADLDKQEGQAESGVYGDLASSLGQIPAEDTLNQNQYNRNLQLAKYIGSLNKPSVLQEALGALNTATNIGAKAAPFF